MTQPTCGFQGAPTIPSSTTNITTTVGTAFTVAGVLASLAKIKALVGPAHAAAAGAAYYVVPAVAAAIAWYVVFKTYYDRCISTPDAKQACSAGVVEAIVPAFSGTMDSVFPFASLPNRVDVVVKQTYWPLVVQNARNVRCSSAGSPMLAGFYKTDQLCAAGLGATIGAGIGAVAGVLIAAAVAAAIGCSTIILCLLALVVAAILAVVAVIIGATAGGAIGRAASDSQSPSSSGGPLIPGQPLTIGDYVTTKGGLIVSEDLDGAIAYWFVTHTSLHGHSKAAPSYSHTDPDTALNPDACQPLIFDAPGIGDMAAGQDDAQAELNAI